MLTLLLVAGLIALAGAVGLGMFAVHDAVVREQARRRLQRAEAVANYCMQELNQRTIQAMVQEVQRHRQGQA